MNAAVGIYIPTPTDFWATDLKRIREAAKQSQLEMGFRFGVDQAQWSRYETGKAEPPEELLFEVLAWSKDVELRYKLVGDQANDMHRAMTI